MLGGLAAARRAVASASSLPAGGAVTVGGVLTLRTTSDTDAASTADGSATDTDTGIGVAVAVNYVDIDNKAYVGDNATVSAGGLTAEAKMNSTDGDGKHTLGAAELATLPDGSIILSAGHGGDEIDVAWLRNNAETVDQIGKLVVRYTLPGGRKVTVLADGHPLNIVANSGSPEPVLLHFVLLGLGLEYLAQRESPPGEMELPLGLEEEAARLALRVIERPV